MSSPFGADDEAAADEGELLDEVGEDEPDEGSAEAGAGGEDPAAP
jgi:hypothetical protein